MKREILFKGKRVDNGEWVEGNLINWHPTLNPRIVNCEIVIGNNQNEVDYNETNSEVHPETVCQSTGLTDKNGKKIFDGDKLECSDIYNDEPYTTTVRFEDGGFLVDAKDCDYDITCIGFLDDEIELEIIGNIHD